MSLKTDYKDDILAVGNLRKYQMIQNNDGTVSFQDVTQYEQTGDVFGAGDINKTNQAVNEKFDSGDVVDPMLTTEPGFAADAYQTKLQFDAQNKNFDNRIGFPDYSRVLDNTTLKSRGASYTATENCWVIGSIKQDSAGTSAYVSIDGIEVCKAINTNSSNIYNETQVFLPVKKGSTFVTRSNAGIYDLKVYAMT